jgi:membrane-associated phospholipid phosphatase
MTDIVPDRERTIANLIGRIFHPAVVALPTLILILGDLGWQSALQWSAITLPILLIPGILLVLYLRKRGKETYQRATRTPLYIAAWFSVVAAIALTVTLDAPRVLVACLALLAIWLPIQLAINTYVTKISTHAAVITGCITALLVLGKLPDLVVQLIAIGIVILVGWARVHDRSHTLTQVVLGIAVAAVLVLLVFPIVLTP